MWSFEISEVSNAVYSCVGNRTTGNKVSIICAEDEIYRIFKQAFLLEIEFKTFPTEALFRVVSGSKPYWDAKYEKEVFGSWIVSNPINKKRIIYDGRDSILVICEGEEEFSWQGRFRAGEDIASEFFKKLV